MIEPMLSSKAGSSGSRERAPRAFPSNEAPPSFPLLAKPSGSTSNVACQYCFSLSCDALYPDEQLRMSESTLEAYIHLLLDAHRTPDVTLAWQGGEPTRMRIDFVRNAGGFVEKYRKPEQRGFGLGKRESRDDSDAGIAPGLRPRNGASRTCAS